MTDQLRQAAQAVIKAWDNDGSTQTMEDLRAALEQQAEPVQEQKYEKRIAPYSTTLSMLLNTTPPQQQAEQVDCPRCGHVCSQRLWVDLTDEDWEKVANRKNTVLDTFEQGAVWAAYKLERRNT